MKTVLLLVVLAAVMCAAPASAAGDVNFDEYFVDKTMRIDYAHVGDAETEIISIDRIYRYGVWAGSLVNLIDRLNYGAYYYKLYDAASGTLVYSRGFDSYFKEYQTSSPAKGGQLHQLCAA